MSTLDEMEMPTLTFDPAPEPEEKAPVVPVQEEKAKLDDSMLNDKERQMVESFAKQIDLHNTNGILQYGAGTQKEMADFSEKALENVKTKDLGSVGDMLTNVVTELKSFDAQEEEKGFFSFLKKPVDKITSMTEEMKKIPELEQKYKLLIKYFEKNFYKPSLNINGYEIPGTKGSGRKDTEKFLYGAITQLNNLVRNPGLKAALCGKKNLIDFDQALENGSIITACSVVGGILCSV